MTDVYLITGFLGAGKTTFLRRFARCFPDRRIGLIVNEFGREGVDGALLREVGSALAEIDNGSIFCACRAEQFDAALRDMAGRGLDVLLIEASGLSDPTEAGALPGKRDLCGMRYAGSVCLIDAARFHKVYATARVLKKQLAAADVFLINKTDLATGRQLEEIRDVLSGMRPGAPVYETTYGQIDPRWVEGLTAPAAREGAAGPHARDITLKKLQVEVLPDGELTPARLRAFVALFAEDTYRVKGFVRLADGCWFVDCVGPLVSVEKWEGEASAVNRLNLLYAAGMPAKKSAEAACALYPARVMGA